MPCAYKTRVDPLRRQVVVIICYLCAILYIGVYIYLYRLRCAVWVLCAVIIIIESYPTTRNPVELLGPCFKTGRIVAPIYPAWHVISYCSDIFLITSFVATGEMTARRMLI